ncbi:MAG: DUF3096 domain-containing protein [Minisyncoccales bacterium]
MVLTLAVSGIVALIAGIVVLVWPKSLNLVVGLWLLISGALQLIQSYA